MTNPKDPIKLSAPAHHARHQGPLHAPQLPAQKPDTKQLGCTLGKKIQKKKKKGHFWSPKVQNSKGKWDREELPWRGGVIPCWEGDTWQEPGGIMVRPGKNVGKRIKKLKIYMKQLRKRLFCKLPCRAHCPSMVERKLELHSNGCARLLRQHGAEPPGTHRPNRPQKNGKKPESKSSPSGEKFIFWFIFFP